MLVLEHTIIGNSADFPLINRSFNLSYSGHGLGRLREKLRIVCIWHIDSGACKWLRIHALNNFVDNIEGLRTHE